jgi:hypothetical protein
MKASLKLIVALAMAAAIGAPSPSRGGTGELLQGQAQTTSLTPEDRAALVDLLTKTRQDFIQSVKGLTQAQWDFKPSPFSWSVAQTAEHIVLSEHYLFNVSQQLLKGPAQTRTSSASAADEDKGLLTRVGDRSHRVMNPAAIAPHGQFKTADDAIAAFTQARDHNIEYAKTTQDDLRHHLTSDGGGGQLDAYEFLLLMAGHSGRHTLQIKEIEANAKYPSSSAD